MLVKKLLPKYDSQYPTVRIHVAQFFFGDLVLLSADSVVYLTQQSVADLIQLSVETGDCNE